MSAWVIHDRLAELLPPDAFAALVREFGGRTIRIPRRIHATRRERTQRVCDALNHGEPYRATAARMGLSLSTVIGDAKRG